MRSSFLVLVLLAAACGDSSNTPPPIDDTDNGTDNDPALTYSVTYDGNGNTEGAPPTDATVYTTGGRATVLGDDSFSRASHNFMGWNTAADGSGAAYATGDVLVIADASVTLYAMWEYVNQQPRFLSGPIVGAWSATEAMRVPFELAMVDDEGDDFTFGFKGCDRDFGTVELCTTAACDATVTLDCSTPYAATNEPYIYTMARPIRGFFTAPQISQSADAVNRLHFVLTDSVSPTTARDSAIRVDARRINVAPLLLIQGQDTSAFVFDTSTGQDFMPDLFVSDADSSQDEFLRFRFVMDVATTNAPSVVIDEVATRAGVTACNDDFVITPTHIELTCTIAPVNELMRRVRVSAPTGTVNGQSVVITATVSDLGNIGQCNISSSEPCILTDQTVATVTWWDV